MTKTKMNKPVELNEAALDDVAGGLPAVQKVREGAAVQGDGSVMPITGAGAGAGPHVKVFSGQTGSEL